MMLPVAIVCLSALALVNGQSEFKDVNTDQGPVRGFSIDDDEMFSFYGIPYATAPRGEDRFKAPLPPPTWTEIFNATTKNIICPQGDRNTNKNPSLKRIYDCLLVNIFVPKTEETNIPVYVYIHGGGFQYGYSAEHSFLEIVKRGVIVASVNYRVGMHGFLCLGTEFAPGNAGLKDQSAALKWVKSNIAHFGGNPDMITVGGNSAGSGSVDLQVVSPMSKGLFTKAILESGSALCSRFVTENPLIIAERFVNQMGLYMNQNVEELENYFRSLTDDDMNLFYADDHRGVGFIPCIEKHNFTGVEKFLPERPIDIIGEGNYEPRSILNGFTPMEGLLFINRYGNEAPLMAANFSDFLPTDIEFESDEHKNNIIGKIKNIYFPTGEITEAGFVDYYTDIYFAYPQYLSARMYVNSSKPVYVYLFTFNGTVNLAAVQTSPIWGPGHIVQTLYIYDNADNSIYQHMTEEDHLIQERLRTMWYNFIVYGEPIPSTTDLLNVKWEPLDNNVSNFLNFDLELTIRQHPLPERIALWDEIYGYFQVP